MKVQDEYERFEGTVTGEITTMLWDHNNNCHYQACCLLIDIGRRPPIVPHRLTREDRDLMAIRQQRYQAKPLIIPTVDTESPTKRLHAWMKQTGATTHIQAATALQLAPNLVKNLLTSNAHLFKFYKKIAGQTYFIAI